MSRASGKRPTEPLQMGGRVIHPGDRISNYGFIREIGSGGMARVLLASNPAGQLVALKVLRRSRFKTGLPRFWREFRALSRISHPNVVAVEDYGDLYGHPFFAMEYVDGPDLHTQIRSFRGWDLERRWTRVEEILVDLCRALSAIHRRGLVHRDLKPSNVLITRDGTCKLTDFGIVKDLDPSADPNVSTTLVGTWAYASPEQISGHPIDHRSDMYSLGVILFAMLTGKRPFVAKDMAGYLALHRDRPAPAPQDVLREVPDHLDEICRRLLQKAPQDRFQSAQEILYRLEAEERAPLTMPGEAWESPLMGRDLEVEALSNAVAALTDRRGSVVVLEGEDGAGKTRLLETAVDRARNLGIPAFRLQFRRADTPFSGILRAGRLLARELRGDTPAELRAALEVFAQGEAPRGDSRYQLYDGMREALRRILEERPLMVTLDDLHEAPRRDIDLMSYLVRTLIAGEDLPLLVMGSLRPKAHVEADAFAAGEELGLEPQSVLVGALSREDIAGMVFALVGDTFGARLLAQRLHRETEGNATFVTEFLRSLMAKDIIAPARATGPDQPPRVLTLEPDEIAADHLEIPPSVRQMMRARLANLGEMERRVLEVLAVADAELDVEVLLEVLDRDEEVVLDAIDRLLAAGIVRERRSSDLLLHAVTHRKYGDVVYRDLPPHGRATLHRKMAYALERHYRENPSSLEVVGEHFRLAGDAGRAYRYLVASAKRLHERALMQEAWELTEKAGAIEESAAVDLSEPEYRLFRRDNLWVRGLVHDTRGEWGDADRAFKAALALAEADGDSRAACKLRLRLAKAAHRLNRLHEWEALAQDALEESRRRHYREGVAEALHSLAALAWNQGELDRCEQLASEGLLVARTGALGEQRAELLLALTASQATKGQLASAISGLSEAEGLFRELRRKTSRCLALANIAELLTWQGEPVEARQRAHVAIQLASDLQFRIGLTAAKRNLAIAARDLGLYEEAYSGLHEALEIAQAIDVPEEMLASHVALTQLAVEQGELSRARHDAARGLELAERRDPERYLPLLQAHLARALGAPDPSAARTLIQASERALSELPLPRRTQVRLALAQAWLILDELEPAREHARSVLQTATNRNYRLLALEARVLMAHLSTAHEAQLHRTAAEDLVRDFTAGLPPAMAQSFRRRPFLNLLEALRPEVPENVS